MSFWDIILMTAFVGICVSECENNITKVFVGIMALAGCALWIALKLGVLGIMM